MRNDLSNSNIFQTGNTKTKRVSTGNKIKIELPSPLRGEGRVRGRLIIKHRWKNSENKKVIYNSSDGIVLVM